MPINGIEKSRRKVRGEPQRLEAKPLPEPFSEDFSRVHSVSRVSHTHTSTNTRPRDSHHLQLLITVGAIFGASIGSSIGAKNALNRAKQEEIKRLGIDTNMLLAAQDVAEALDRANQGLATVQDSLASLQRFAKRLENDADAVLQKAKLAVQANDDDTARAMLLERQQLLDKLKAILKDCVDMKARKETMESNVALLQRKAIEIETLLQRTVGAKAMMDVGSLGLSLDDEDPLLRKFRDLGID
jgi:hypothetical protein